MATVTKLPDTKPFKLVGSRSFSPQAKKKKKYSSGNLVLVGFILSKHVSLPLLVAKTAAQDILTVALEVTLCDDI